MKTFEEVFEITKGISCHPALEDPEVRGLYDACTQVPAGGLVVEVGCQLGRSSSVIVQMAAERHYHSVHIDPFILQPDFLQAWVRNMFNCAGPERHDFTLLCMKTEWAGWQLERLCSTGVDMAFIDGNHDYDDVRTDLRMIASKIKLGGLLTAHDYGRESLPDVYRAINDFIDVNGDWQEVGVFGTLGVWRRL